MHLADQVMADQPCSELCGEKIPNSVNIAGKEKTDQNMAYQPSSNQGITKTKRNQDSKLQELEIFYFNKRDQTKADQPKVKNSNKMQEEINKVKDSSKVKKPNKVNNGEEFHNKMEDKNIPDFREMGPAITKELLLNPIGYTHALICRPFDPGGILKFHALKNYQQTFMVRCSAEFLVKHELKADGRTRGSWNSRS